MKKYLLKYIGFCMMLCFSQIAFSAQPIQLTFENYTDQSLSYVKRLVVRNSTLTLPESVPTGNPAFANGSVVIDANQTEAEGSFRMGFDEEHYCEYHYVLQKQTIGWFWFMRPIKWVGMDQVSCAVDPDVHRMVVFQEMGVK